MARTLIVTTLHISDATATKLADEHDLDAEDVRAQIEGVGRLPFKWDICPDRGPRALVPAVVDDDAVLVVLYPSRTGDPEEWHLGSAYPDEPPA